MTKGISKWVEGIRSREIGRIESHGEEDNIKVLEKGKVCKRSMMNFGESKYCVLFYMQNQPKSRTSVECL
jgi:hypothetical protein